MRGAELVRSVDQTAREQQASKQQMTIDGPVRSCGHKEAEEFGGEKKKDGKKLASMRPSRTCQSSGLFRDLPVVVAALLPAGGLLAREWSCAPHGSGKLGVHSGSESCLEGRGRW